MSRISDVPESIATFANFLDPFENVAVMSSVFSSNVKSIKSLRFLVAWSTGSSKATISFLFSMFAAPFFLLFVVLSFRRIGTPCF